jgi:hypothetical protein
LTKVGILFRIGCPTAPEEYEVSEALIIDEACLPEYESIMEEILNELTEYENGEFDKWGRLENKLTEAGVQYELLKNLQEEYRFLWICFQNAFTLRSLT